MRPDHKSAVHTRQGACLPELRDYSQSSQCVTGISLRLAASCGCKIRRPLARWCGHTGLGKGRDHRDRLGWEHPPPGAHDTGSLTEAGRCESLLGHVLAIPPPYRTAPGCPVLVLHAGDRAIVPGEDNLIGSLRQLATTILAAGDPCLCTIRVAQR